MNTQQQLAIDRLNQFINQNHHNVFYLMGYAGTGKTFLISHIILDLLNNEKIRRAFVCAPTNKALNVITSYIREMIVATSQDRLLEMIRFLTIHRLLEFKPVISIETGEKLFKAKQASKILKSTRNQLIVIDECSMVSTEMADELDSYIKTSPTKVVFLGDNAQLAPINEPNSVIFVKIPQDYHFHIVLDEIMRTKSPEIQQVSTIIRQWNKRDALIKLLLPFHNRKSFTLYHHKPDCCTTTWFHKITSETNPERIPIILTWRNKTCDAYNYMIRQYLHQSNDLGNYLVNDYMMFNNYYKSPANEEDRFYTSDRIKIVEIEVKTQVLYNWSTFDFDKTNSYLSNIIDKIAKVENTYEINILHVKRIPPSENTPIIHVISMSDVVAYWDMLKTVSNLITRYFNKTGDEKGTESLWMTYHLALCDRYAEINFGYSLTIHKAQGSTFDIVFVDVDDISHNGDSIEFQRLLYTATTRASKTLGFLVK